MDEPGRCPECGYTHADARLHMDHNLCKNYPFFTQSGGYEVGVFPDVPTGSPEGIAKQPTSAENRLLDFVRRFIREYDVVWVDPGDSDCVWDELYEEAEAIVNAVAVDTNEERTTACQATHGGDK